MPIKINRIKPQTVSLYDPEDNYLGDINECEFNDIRVQIATNQATGYYVKFKDEVIPIDNWGHPYKWPAGFFTFNQECHAKIIRKRYCARYEKNEEDS